MKHVVIVESPTKAQTISRFLDNKYDVVSSYGHIRDLPKTDMGVAVENNFEPTYVVPPRSRKHVSELKKHIKKADTVILATDEDREGEAIAWHIVEALGLGDKKSQTKNHKAIQRIVFHEITKDAIARALENPRGINQNLVNAQQARRVLDRLVGYTLSPLLWKKVMRGLSAGRVQSVAVRLIVERERERDAFTPQEYWSIHADLATKENETLQADVWKQNDKKLTKFAIGSKKEADAIVRALKDTTWSVGDVQTKKTKRNPLPPFTTSTLQQEANRRLGFSAKQTMVIAQQLYEGIAFGGEHEGLITYMRTDSTNIAKSAQNAATAFITRTYGDTYSAPKNFTKKSARAQEAHEAVRPTDPTRTPESLAKHLDARQHKLYTLIWQRFVASQMAPATFDATTVTIETETDYTLRARGLVQTFDGFMRVWPASLKEEMLPRLTAGDTLTLKKLTPEQHETKPPARYSEATLVKALEEFGIGRPSTYAPIMSTIQDRKYVEKDDQKRFFPTEIGMVVTDLLIEHFPTIVDIDFTAHMEDTLDNVAAGEKEWQPVIKEFYEPFARTVTEKEKSLSRSDIVSVKKLGTDPKTKKPVHARIGRYGPYIQLGDKEDEEKPKFAAIPKGRNMENITLEEALELLALPRELGTTEDEKDITTGIGRYGPYVKVGDAYASLPEDSDPLTVTKDEALKIFAEYQKTKGKKILKEFSDSDIKIASGRYGPYVTDGKTNASIPKDIEPTDLTLKEAETILKEKPKHKKRKKTKKKTKK